jgi:hypothetical protein
MTGRPPRVSRLKDGRLFLSYNDCWLVSSDGGVSWEVPEGFKYGTGFETQPFFDETIRFLIASAIHKEEAHQEAVEIAPKGKVTSWLKKTLFIGKEAGRTIPPGCE